MSSLKLTDLPVELQALIADKLLAPHRRSSTRSLSDRNDAFQNPFLEFLPDDLLRAAQASPILAKAVIYAIGQGVHSLSFKKTERPWEWIPILKNYVKSVDFTGVRALLPLQGIPLLKDKQIEGDIQDQATFSTLKALHSNGVQLEKLNLKGVELFNPNLAKNMAQYLERAIQGSSSSLKEICLGANQASVQAMKKAKLPKLEIVRIYTDWCSNTYDIQNSHPFSSEKALCQILKALDTNTEHNSIRALILHLSYFVPKVKFKTCPHLFLSIKKLYLTFKHVSEQGGVAKFISNFKNLESLKWTACSQVLGAVKNVAKIFTECPKLKHLNLCCKCLSRRPGGIGIPQNSPMMNNFFRSFRGQLQAVNLHYLTNEQIKLLGETNPNLTNLYLCIDHESVQTLSLLLGTHCQQLSQLHLRYSKYTDHCLGSAEWSALSNAIRCASPYFHTISFIDDMDGIDRATEDMVDAIIDILEFMDDRAKKVRFKIAMRTTNPLVVLKGLWRTLQSAMVHSKSIQELCFDFSPGSTGHLLRSHVKKSEICHWYDAVSNLRNILSTFKYVAEVDIGNISSIQQCYGDS